METASFFAALKSVSEKPRPFSVYTAKELWTDEHTSEQMLAFHLNGEIDVSSRRVRFIDESVRWLQQHFDLTEGSRVIDFGCGPGLYTSRLAAPGMDVVGIDFSSRSIEYARQYARRQQLDVTYIEADYLDLQPEEGKFDLITMIMCDFCALSPLQRGRMLEKFEEFLSDRGRLVLDLYSLSAFADRREGLICERNQLDGFWSPNPYFGFVASFRYEEEKVSLDKYTIVEEDRQKEIYNWLQYFTPATLDREAHAAGLQIDGLYGDVAGNQYDPHATEFAVVMRRR